METWSYQGFIVNIPWESYHEHFSLSGIFKVKRETLNENQANSVLKWKQISEKREGENLLKGVLIKSELVEYLLQRLHLIKLHALYTAREFSYRLYNILL